MDEQIFAIQPYGGISRLFTELAREFLAYPDHGVDLLPLSAPIVNRYILDNSELATRLATRPARNQWTALAWYFSHIERRRADVIHNTFYLPHGLAAARGSKRVVTVYDMIPERMPDTRRRLDFLTLKRRYVEKADHIICISEATRDDLEDIYGKLNKPVSVVPLGVDPRFNPQVDRINRLPENYILFVGHRGQYKNASVLVQAFSDLATKFPDLQVAYVGGGRFTTTEQNVIKQFGLTGRVVQIDLPDESMPSAYAHAKAFVFPSHFEGFGLPVLEAMACAVPAVLARATSLPEVGGSAAAYFTPDNPEELAGELDAILSDSAKAEGMKQAGLRWAQQFPWSRTAEQTAEIYRQVLS